MVLVLVLMEDAFYVLILVRDVFANFAELIYLEMCSIKFYWVKVS